MTSYIENLLTGFIYLAVFGEGIHVLHLDSFRFGEHVFNSAIIGYPMIGFGILGVYLAMLGCHLSGYWEEKERAERRLQ